MAEENILLESRLMHFMEMMNCLKLELSRFILFYALLSSHKMQIVHPKSASTVQLFSLMCSIAQISAQKTVISISEFIESA